MRARARGGRELQSRRLLVALVLLALAPALPACGARSASAAPAAGALDATHAANGCASRRGNKRSRFREMTWDEYYTDVRERAWRNAATIIWITPPKVKRRRPEAAAANSSTSATTTACAR